MQNADFSKRLPNSNFNCDSDADTSADATPITIAECVWQPLENLQAVEDWLDSRNRELQQLVGRRIASGQGICFTLQHGGECYLHTNSDGDVLLDVTADAAWITPVIAAATQATPPKGCVWLLPNNVLTQLILGMDSLIASSRLVLAHTYKAGRGFG